MTNKNEYYQYDSCISRGICSINPRTYSLQRVLIRYLILISKYALDLYNLGVIDKLGEELILNTLANVVSNPEFTERSFVMFVKKFKTILPKIAEKYKWLCNEKNIKDLDFESLDLFKESSNIIKAIRYGEKDMLNMQQVPQNIRDLFRIMLIIAKSISINLLDLESFGKKYDEGFKTILELLNAITSENQDKEKLKLKVIKAANIDNKIMHILRETQEEIFGKQKVSDVSFSTFPSKAVLVVGSNIKELENVLEALKNTDIDVYTHDDMMLAHTFPKFNEYKNLKGQFGQGIENCLLDFATFPGPIVLTKHSLHNIENFYRGILFTTDYTNPRGINKIQNNDYTKLIEACNNSKGFKTGRQCETISIGYDYNEQLTKITNKLNNENYKRIFLIGLEHSSFEQKTYFEKLVKIASPETLIISFSYNSEQSNLIHINTCYDSFGMVKFYEKLKDLSYPITIFIPKCDKNSISQIIQFAQNKNTTIFIGVCTPIVLNPSLLVTLNNEFKVKILTSAQKDFDVIVKE